MIYFKKYIGTSIILLGVILLITLHLLHFTIVNTLLFIPLGCIILGIIIHVWMMKRENLY